MGGTYVNAMSGEESEDRVRRAYGPAKYDRLARIKQGYDPTNLFHRNTNIAPASPAPEQRQPADTAAPVQA